MAFEFEELDEASVIELQRKIPKSQPILSLSPNQAIDRERDIIFLSLGGKGYLPPESSEPPYFYALLWKGSCVVFQGYEAVESTPGGARVNLNLTNLSMPEALRDKSSDIQKSIEDAASVFQSATRGRPVSVFVQLQTIIYH